MISPSAIRLSTACAIAWTIIAEIVRNQGASPDLRVIEMHPGGGLYHLLRLLKVPGENALTYGRGAEPLADFNVLTGKMSRARGGAPYDYPWLERWLTLADPEQVVDEAIETLELPIAVTMPPTTRRIFGFRLVAAILGSRLMQRDYLHGRMGFGDTAGYGGGVASELSDFTAVFPPQRDEDPDLESSRAADCWLLLSGAERSLRGVARMDGVISSVSAPHEAHDLFEVYRSTRSMSAVVAEASTILKF